MPQRRQLMLSWTLVALWAAVIFFMSAHTGSDFDGADLPQFLSSPTKAAGLYGELAERYGTALCDQLFYGNTMRFFEENLG